MIEAINPLRELTLVSILFRFLFAGFCGSLIGFERGRKRHEAGLRTHVVVCIGSASVMILNQYLMVYFNPAADPARLGAQVISGIGFLGAGTIMITGYQRGQRIRGLTTAAGLWASACMGLIIGSGFYEAAVIMCAFLFCAIVTMNVLDEKYFKDSMGVRIYIEYSKDISFSSIVALLRENHWHLTNVERLKVGNDDINSVLVDMERRGQNTEVSALVEALKNLKGVLFVEET